MPERGARHESARGHRLQYVEWRDDFVEIVLGPGAKALLEYLASTPDAQEIWKEAGNEPHS